MMAIVFPYFSLAFFLYFHYFHLPTMYLSVKATLNLQEEVGLYIDERSNQIISKRLILFTS